MGISVQECPLCRTPLSETRFAEVQATIREEEQARFTAARQQMEHEFAQRLKTETAAAVQRAKVEGQKANDALVTERGQMAEKISQLEAREATFQADRSKAIATLKADFDRKSRQQAQDAEKRAKDASAKQLDGLAAEAAKLTKQVAALEQAKGEVEAARKKSEQEAERNMRKAATDAQRVAQLETEKLRATLDKHREAELIKQRGQFAREREAWQQKISDLSRKLEHKTAHELGEFPEIDLHGALRDAFAGDKIRRVAKGEPGADVIHQVVYKGEICGTIVLDSKNHKGWQKQLRGQASARSTRAQGRSRSPGDIEIPTGRQRSCHSGRGHRHQAYSSRLRCQPSAGQFDQNAPAGAEHEGPRQEEGAAVHIHHVGPLPAAVRRRREGQQRPTAARSRGLCRA